MLKRIAFIILIALCFSACNNAELVTLPRINPLQGPFNFDFSSSKPFDIESFHCVVSSASLNLQSDRTFVYSKDFVPYAKEIYKECLTRFSDPIVVMCHGGGEGWDIFPDNQQPWPTEELAKAFAKRYPDHDIVIWACNRRGRRINVPRVWYFTTLVWIQPDEAYKVSIDNNPLRKLLLNITTIRETQRNFGLAGSIWEAVTQNNSN